MIKKILLLSLAVLLGVYLVFALVFMNPKANNDNECSKLKVTVVKNSDIIYLNESQIETYLKKVNLYPIGKKLSEINIDVIEKALSDNKLIKTSESYKAIDGTVKIKIYQRTPVLRIISEKDNYYVDDERKKMPIPPDFTAYVPVATGAITEKYAQTQLYDFALFLQKNDFWNAQIEQIYIAPNQDVELIPRVGDHRILLGKIENYKENLDKLKLFYSKGLNKTGWNRYSLINLKYKNQIVCTKQE
jgi:cell division protein FtsQ